MKCDTFLGFENFGCKNFSPTHSIRTSKNVFLLGDTGTGKGRHYIKRQLQNFYGSYVVIDVSRTMYNEYADSYKANGWDTKIIDFSSGPKVNYNPFLYLTDDTDLHQFIDITLGRYIYTPGNDVTSDYSKYSKQMLFCIVRLMQYMLPKSAWNIGALSSFMKKNYNFFRENMDKYLLESGDKSAQNCYHSLPIMSEEMWKSIMIKIAVSTDEFQLLDFDNTIDLTNFRNQKSIVFIEIPTTYISVLVSVLVNQLCNLLHNDTSREIPVHIILDEFQNLYLPNMMEFLNSATNINIQYSIITQCIQQIKALYCNWDRFIRTFDNILVYTCRDYETVEFLYRLVTQQYPNLMIQKTFMKRRLFLHPRTVSKKLFLSKEMFLKLSDNESILISKDNTMEIKLLYKYI